MNPFKRKISPLFKFTTDKGVGTITLNMSQIVGMQDMGGTKLKVFYHGGEIEVELASEYLKLAVMKRFENWLDQ